MQEDTRVTEAKLENETIIRAYIIEMHELQIEHWEYANKTLKIREDRRLALDLINLKFNTEFECKRAATEIDNLEDDKYIELYRKMNESRYKEKLELIGNNTKKIKS